MKELTRRVWEGQLVALFPLFDTVRRAWINETAHLAVLPSVPYFRETKNPPGKRINYDHKFDYDFDDCLYWIGRNARYNHQKDHQTFTIMVEARNFLAHLKPMNGEIIHSVVQVIEQATRE